MTMPEISLAVVTNGPEDTAESMHSRGKAAGIRVPVSDATRMTSAMEVSKVRPKTGFRCLPWSLSIHRLSLFNIFYEEQGWIRQFQVNNLTCFTQPFEGFIIQIELDTTGVANEDFVA
jgi:hypothetical protein